MNKGTKRVSCLAVSLMFLTTACGLFSAEDTTKSESGFTNVTAMPCAMAGGSCVAAQECGVGTGSIGTGKFSCGGSRRVCCFAQCGSEKEDFECCNAGHTFAPRPLCQDGKLTCAAGQTKVPIGTCVRGASGASHGRGARASPACGK